MNKECRLYLQDVGGSVLGDNQLHVSSQCDAVTKGLSTLETYVNVYEPPQQFCRGSCPYCPPYVSGVCPRPRKRGSGEPGLSALLAAPCQEPGCPTGFRQAAHPFHFLRGAEEAAGASLFLSRSWGKPLGPSQPLGEPAPAAPASCPLRTLPTGNQAALSISRFTKCGPKLGAGSSRPALYGTMGQLGPSCLAFLSVSRLLL